MEIADRWDTVSFVTCVATSSGRPQAVDQEFVCIGAPRRSGAAASEKLLQITKK